ISLLLIIHPKNLLEKTMFNIDQFLLKGGRILLFIDPLCESDVPKDNNPYAALSSRRDSNLEKLLKAWGLEMVKNKVVLDRALATMVNTEEGVIPHIAWLTLTEDNINRDDVVTAKLDNILLPSAGVLKVNKKDNITYRILFKTTEKASTIDANTLRFTEPKALLETFKIGSKAIPLSIRLTGKFKTAFDKPPKGIENKEWLKESSKETSIIVVSDVDMLSNRFSVQIQHILGRTLAIPFNDNLNFLYNAVENLCGSTDLISIRSRGRFYRPFIKVREIEMAAEERWKAEEMRLKQRLDEINARLRELQKPINPDKQYILSKAIEDEIAKYRMEKLKAQKRLREVRRRLREDKERLGNILFLLDTFLVPTIICFIGFGLLVFKA
ncbi:MAG: hypothetical protein D6828_04125, partial [Nitrospirae bacterium]